MDRDLLLAILAMDAYNRGYGAGIKDLLEEGRLGNARLLAAPTREGWEDAGFYAIAYEYNGEKIISYRGTPPVVVGSYHAC